MARLHRLLLTVDSSAAAPPPEAVAVESDFVVILAALLCALICVVGLMALARCACLRRGPNSAARSAAQAAAPTGMKKKVLESLPKRTYSSGTGAKFVSLECAICLSEFAEGEEIRVLPQCGHAFHVSCIDTWLGSHSSCPSCRQALTATRCKRCGRFSDVSSDLTAWDMKVGGESNHCSDNDLSPSK